MQLSTLTYAFKQKLIHRTYNIYVQKRSRNFIRGKRQRCSLLHDEQLCCLLRLGYQRPIKKINSDQRLSARNSKNNFACFVFLAFKNFDLRLAKKLRLGKHYLTEAFKNILFFCPLYTYPWPPSPNKNGPKCRCSRILIHVLFFVTTFFSFRWHQENLQKIWSTNDKNYCCKLIIFDNWIRSPSSFSLQYLQHYPINLD